MKMNRTMQIPQNNVQEECAKKLRRLSIGSKIFSDSSSILDETPDLFNEEGNVDCSPNGTVLLFPLSLAVTSLCKFYLRCPGWRRSR